MSQENVAIVRDYFESVNSGDFAQAMRYYAFPDRRSALEAVGLSEQDA
jgi:hypothetical protein